MGSHLSTILGGDLNSDVERMGAAAQHAGAIDAAEQWSASFILHKPAVSHAPDSVLDDDEPAAPKVPPLTATTVPFGSDIKSNTTGGGATATRVPSGSTTLIVDGVAIRSASVVAAAAAAAAAAAESTAGATSTGDIALTEFKPVVIAVTQSQEPVASAPLNTTAVDQPTASSAPPPIVVATSEPAPVAASVAAPVALTATGVPSTAATPSEEEKSRAAAVSIVPPPPPGRPSAATISDVNPTAFTSGVAVPDATAPAAAAAPVVVSIDITPAAPAAVSDTPPAANTTAAAPAPAAAAGPESSANPMTAHTPAKSTDSLAAASAAANASFAQTSAAAARLSVSSSAPGGSPLVFHEAVSSTLSSGLSTGETYAYCDDVSEMMNLSENTRAFFWHMKLGIGFFVVLSLIGVTMMLLNAKTDGAHDLIYGSSSTWFLTSLGNANSTGPSYYYLLNGTKYWPYHSDPFVGVISQPPNSTIELNYNIAVAPDKQYPWYNFAMVFIGFIFVLFAHPRWFCMGCCARCRPRNPAAKHKRPLKASDYTLEFRKFPQNFDVEDFVNWVEEHYGTVASICISGMDGHVYGLHKPKNAGRKTIVAAVVSSRDESRRATDRSHRGGASTDESSVPNSPFAGGATEPPPPSSPIPINPYDSLKYSDPKKKPLLPGSTSPGGNSGADQVKHAAPALVLITFSQRDDRDACLERNAGIRTYFQGCFSCCAVPQYKFVSLSIKAAKEPTDIIWANQSESAKTKIMRRSLTWLFGSGLWVLMYLVLLSAERNKPDDDGAERSSIYAGFVSIGLVLWMKLSQSIVGFLASFEKHHSYSAADLSILRNRFILETMHYAAVFVVVFWYKNPNPETNWNNTFTYNGKNVPIYPQQYNYWYTEAAPILGSMYISEAVFYVALAFLPAYSVRKWVAVRVAETQSELNRAFEPPEVDIYGMYTTFFVSVSISFVFCSGLPWVTVIAIFKLIVVYAIEKYNLLRRYRAPQFRDLRMARFVGNSMMVVMWFAALGAIVIYDIRSFGELGSGRDGTWVWYHRIPFVFMAVLFALISTYLTSSLWLPIPYYFLCCCLFSKEDAKKAGVIATCGFSGGYWHMAGRWVQAWWRNSVYNTIWRVRGPTHTKTFEETERERNERIMKRRRICYEDIVGIDSYLDVALAATRKYHPDATIADKIRNMFSEYHPILYYKLLRKWTSPAQCRACCTCCDCCADGPCCTADT